jgi:hypothetical protein
VSPADIRLLSGEADLADYQFGPRRIHHRFCRACGVRPFGQAHLESTEGGFYAVSIAALDGVDPAVLAAVPVIYVDGRNDDFESAPAETRHL